MGDLQAALRVLSQAASDWWDDWVNMFMIGLVWLLSWATLVLGPPATLGLWYVANEVVHGHSRGLSGFLTGGRRFFLTGWLWALINLLVVVVLGVNIWFYGQSGALWARLVQTLVLMLALVWMIVQFYTLPYLMEQEEKSVKLAMRNGLLTALAAPAYTAVVVGAALLIAGLSAGLVVPLFIGGPGLVAVLANRAVVERLQTYQLQD